MSRIVTTDLGRFRAIVSDGVNAFLFECPGCGEWGHLDDDQWNGRVSVDHASQGCVGHYHETHNYQATLRAVVAVARINGDDPFEDDTPPYDAVAP